MKKVIIIVAAVLLLAFLAVGFFIDSIAASAIENQGSKALGVGVHAGSVDVGILSGGFSLSGLEIDNPEGFQSPHVARVGNLELNVSLGTLMDDKIVAPRLYLSDIEIWLEGARGRTNVQTIQENLRKNRSQDDSSAGGSGKRFVIEKVLVERITATINMPPLAKDLKIEIPQVELDNVGGGPDGEGVSQSQLMQQILNRIAQRAQQEALNNPEGVVDQIRNLLKK
ncbi:MAG TPA: hypothetical protein VLV83_00420 [Acidobacteriota bacterium]|nr:hypothetical protein [Acidobacteriota bacterium]